MYLNTNTPTLGGIQRTQNTTDFPLGAFTPTVCPPSYTTDISNLFTENQMKLPDCGANGGGELKGVQDNFRPSVAYLWKRIKQIDNYPPEAGTDLLSIMKALNKVGVCSFKLLPTDSTQDLKTFTDPSVITQEMDADAQDHRIDTYAFQFNPTMEQIKSAIYTHGVVIALIRVGSEFWTPSWAAKDILPLRPPVSPVGGHFILLYGYDKENIYFRNSWGNSWGANGNGYFNSSYIPYVVEMGTAVDTSGGRFKQNLEYGMANLDVYSLQKFLVKGGYGNFVPTAFFGEKTRQAVIAYQKAKGIKPTLGFFYQVTRGYVNKEYAQTM